MSRFGSDDEPVWNLPPPPPVPPDPIEYTIPSGQIARGANPRLPPQVQQFEDVRAKKPRVEFPTTDSEMTVDPDKVEGPAPDSSKPIIQNPVKIVSEDGSINIYIDKFGRKHDLNKLVPKKKPTFRNLPPRRESPPHVPFITPPSREPHPHPRADDRPRYREFTKERDTPSLPQPIPPVPVLRVTKDGRIVNEDRVVLR